MAGPTTYSARYATRQLSISGIRSPPTAATPERRSFLASPTTSIHGSTVPPAHHSVRTARSSSPLPPLPHPANVLAGAAAALSAQGSHARPSAVEGSGWHMATADGLPFQPKGTLVASSGGSRTLRPITSQQVYCCMCKQSLHVQVPWRGVCLTYEHCRYAFHSAQGIPCC